MLGNLKGPNRDARPVVPGKRGGSLVKKPGAVYLIIRFQ